MIGEAGGTNKKTIDPFHVGRIDMKLQINTDEINQIVKEGPVLLCFTSTRASH